MRTTRLSISASAAALSILAANGCGGSSSDEPLAEVSDAISRSQVRVIGSISDGDAKVARYSNPPRYRAYRFTASTGDTIDVSVSAARADAVAWITDARFRNLAMNDDASGETLDSAIHFVVPSGVSGGTFYVAFREYSYRTTTMTVRFGVHPSEVCNYDGAVYNVGDNFPSSDGCNTCSCGPAGNVGCTKRLCPRCDPSNEPNRSYVSESVEECTRIRFICAPDWSYFSNTCGCGCESP